MRILQINIAFLLSLLTATISSTAQNLEKKIPANATIVVTIKTGELLQMMPASELSNTLSGKKLLEMISNKSGKEVKDINELGINLNNNSYFFRSENDSMSFNCILIPVADAAKFGELITTKSGIKLTNNIRSSNSDDSTAFMMWDNRYAMIAEGELKDFYFNTKEVAERYGLTYMPPYVYNDSAVDVTTPAFADTTYTVAADTVVVEAPTTDVVAVDTSVAVVEAPYNYDYYDKDRQIKKVLAAQWANTILQELFAKDPAISITANESYAKCIDDKALATVWMQNPMGIYYSSLPYSMYGGAMGRFSSGLMSQSGYKGIVAKMYAEEKQLRMVTDFEMEPMYADMYKKIYSRKLNKQFLKYINTDSLLGYMAWSIDTKSYLQEFPKMMEQAYGNAGLGVTSDEIGIGSELISLLLDEEAVGNVIKGDALVVFNGVYQHEITYTDYEYDDNFNAKEVKKTKKESIPAFTFMFSSDESSLARKIINYGIKKETIKANGAFYEVQAPSTPFPVYFMQKDGIFLFTNSLIDMQQIATNSYTAKISKEQKRLMMGSNFSAFMSPQKTNTALSASGMDITNEFAEIMNTLEKMGPVYIKTLPITGNNISAIMTMDVPEGNTNALKYFFTVIDTFIK
jgi:hypothetical protein